MLFARLCARSKRKKNGYDIGAALLEIMNSTLQCERSRLEETFEWERRQGFFFRAFVVISGAGQQERFPSVMRKKAVLLFFRATFLVVGHYQQGL